VWLVAVACAVYLCWIFLPDVDWPRRRRGPRGRGRVALTFDDGPGADTARVLDVLERRGARATFFCVGRAAEAQPALIRRMAAAGHTIGNHTWDHAPLPFRSATEIAHQIARTQAALVAAGAPRPRWFRAPHGWKSPFLSRALRREKLQLVAWTHGVWDTAAPVIEKGAREIARRVIARLNDGDIILLHDGGGDRAQTALALDEILDGCAARGLRPVTLEELYT
jgi:peptidoglycan/xylan/chitin deacetylase (PgdA/CDA1 family)